jgi:hypothetical protein
MKKSLVGVLVMICLLVPGIIPTIAVSNTAPTGHVELTVSPGGTACAWNLIYELCRAGIPEMCDLYWHGEGEGWWN